jgi:hypothetical protein
MVSPTGLGLRGRQSFAGFWTSRRKGRSLRGRHEAATEPCGGGLAASPSAWSSVRHGDESRAAIFNMDGALIDSEPHHHATWHRLCREEGVIFTLAQVAERTLWRPVRESLPALPGRLADPAEMEPPTRRKAGLTPPGVCAGHRRRVRHRA